MAGGKFISYLRVSTTKQGASGLGLEAQRETVATYLNGGAWTLLGEFVEVESGRRSDRPQLMAALAQCRVMGAILVVANVSRLTRSPDFMAVVVEAGVEVRFCDLPQIEGPAGKFMLRQMLAVAELEAGMIGERTKKALAAAKARGTVLGGDRGNLGSVRAVGQANSARVRSEKAARRAKDLASTVAELQNAGATSLRALGAALNGRGIEAPRGGQWQAKQVALLLARL